MGRGSFRLEFFGVHLISFLRKRSKGGIIPLDSKAKRGYRHNTMVRLVGYIAYTTELSSHVTK